MNAIRQIVSPQNGRLLIEIPKEYQQKRFEVIVFPIDESDAKTQIQNKMAAFLATLPADEDPQKMAMAHKIIDMGTAVSHDFISDFEQSKQDRSLPFRNE